MQELAAGLEGFWTRVDAAAPIVAGCLAAAGYWHWRRRRTPLLLLLTLGAVCAMAGGALLPAMQMWNLVNSRWFLPSLLTCVSLSLAALLLGLAAVGLVLASAIARHEAQKASPS